MSHDFISIFVPATQIDIKSVISGVYIVFNLTTESLYKK